MAAEDKLFKLQKLERTKQLINDINFTKAVQLPKAAGAETLNPTTSASSQSFLLRRTQDLVNRHDMSAIEPHIKIFSEFDPANPYYSSLLNRINHGEHITWKEFEDAVNRFSSQEYYLTKLQDEINNTKINASLEGVPEEELEKPIAEIAEALDKNEVPESEKTPEPSHDPGIPHAPEAHTEESPTFRQRPRALSPQAEENLKKTNQVMQKTQTQIKQGQAPQLTEKASAKLNSANRMMRVRPTNVTSINSKNRRKIPTLKRIAPKVGAAAGLGGGGAAAGSGALGNVLGARSLLQAGQWLANKLGLKSLGNLLGKLMPEKLIAQGIRGLWNLGSGFGRAAFDGLVRNVFTWVPKGGMFGSAGSTIGGWFAGGAAVVGSIGIWTILAWIVGILGFFTFIWAVYDANTECGQPGKVELNKTSDKESYQAGEQINYTITLNYNIKCTSAYLDKAEVKDTIPTGTTYVPNSAKSTKVANAISDPVQIQDPLADETGDSMIPEIIDPEFPAANDIGLDGNTLTWRLGKVDSNNVITMTFSATANQTDTWISNQATAGFLIVSNSGLFGGGIVPGGENEPANQDTCGGTYTLSNPKGNFGDPSCNFDKDALYTLLQQNDPANADYWFNVVIKCESSYNPNAHADHATVGTPDAGGAWGLYQMGQGKNGQYDHGDVAWQLQSTNAVTYNNNLGNLKWRYWQCARDRW